MADTATETTFTEISPVSEHESSRQKLLSQTSGGHHDESVYCELAIDYVYCQKFSIKATDLEKFKEALKGSDGYIHKMLNHKDKNYGDVFFKVQLYYDVNATGDHTCIMNFHLFSIESINEEKERMINGFIEECFAPPNIAQLVSTEILIRAGTHLREPVVP